VMSKKRGTEGGNPAVMVQIGDQTLITTARQFLEVAAAISAIHPGAGERSHPELPAGSIIKGVHRGVRWEAVLIEMMYLVTSECARGSIQLAGDEKSAEALAVNLIDRVTAAG
jgi:hypothetical protein